MGKINSWKIENSKEKCCKKILIKSPIPNCPYMKAPTSRKIKKLIHLHRKIKFKFAIQNPSDFIKNFNIEKFDAISN
jgi:hypothetical protein